jgi:O-antigen biosynthesis protein
VKTDIRLREILDTKKIVVVLGMHRSGTSAITRGLKVMGVDLGERLMPAHREVNPKGFWEDIDINELNEEILRELGSTWRSLSLIRCVDVQMLRDKGFHGRATELVRSKISDTAVFGLKDPRISKILPFWKGIFKDLTFDVRYILTLRHPLSVAKSLEKRDGLSLDKSYLMWLEHVLISLAETQGEKRVLVDFDRLMLDPDVELKRISSTVGLHLDEQELEIYKSSFLEVGLRHTAYQLEDLQHSAEAPALLLEMFEVLQRIAEGKSVLDEPEFLRRVEMWHHRLLDMQSALRLVDKSDVQIASLGESLEQRNITLKKQDKKLRDLEHDLREQKSRFTEMQVQLGSVLSSGSWKITRPLRELRRLTSNLQAGVKDYFRLAIRACKRIYMELPLQQQTRVRHRRLIARALPGLLQTEISFGVGNFPLMLLKFKTEYSPEVFRGVFKVETSVEPLVSVIIPVYGKGEYTLRCLASISNNSPDNPFEVIVVDDCSPDSSYEILKNVVGIRLLSNDKNQGFIRSCNIGAAAAKGQYVYFLNNDTEVTPGWLDELVRTFTEFPGTGLTGSRLIYPDGTLQEAGGIIWQDGSAWNFGRNQSPLLPIFSYAREVDYCSGASIMVPTALFDELGGFDEHYLPAYCEDCDLALKIREKGRRVIYQPLSTVIHHEGVTSGTDTKQGVKAYQATNTRKLFERWQDRLKSHQPNGQHVDQAKDRCATKRVLLIDLCTPTPDQDAGSVLIYNLMLLLREMDFQVTFIPDDNFLYLHDQTKALQRTGVEVLYSPFVTSVMQHLKEFGARYDLVLLVRPLVVEKNIDLIRKFCPKAKVLFHTVDLHFVRMAREAKLSDRHDKKQVANEMKKREYAAIRAVDATIVVSTAEMELLRPDFPAEKIYLYPLIMEIPGTTRRFGERRDIAFVGSYQHAPNVDAVLYFILEIMPLLREKLPGVCFHVVGINPPEEILVLASSDVIIEGYVEDLQSLLDNMRVAVAPLRYGAGIKGKIGSAMSVGLPTVATPLAAEGMSLTSGENILIAGDASDFARAIAELYENEPLWNSISEASILFADAVWGPEAAWKTLNEILANMGIQTLRHDRPLKLYSSRRG